MKNKLLAIILLSLFAGMTGTAQVKKGTQDQAYRFQMENGKLKLKKNYVSFGTVDPKHTKSDTIHILNNSQEELKLNFTRVPESIKMLAVPEVLKPETKGYILITYTPSLHKGKNGGQHWGAVNIRANIEVNGNTQNSYRNVISIRASVEEDFSKYTKKQLAKAPKIEFDTLTYDFGTVTQGTVLKHDFVFVNKGKEDLEIRHVKGG